MIRSALLTDLSRIAEIQIAGWRSAYRGLISDYELFTERQVVFTVERLKKRMAENNTMIVYEDEEDQILKGFAWHGISRDEDKPSTYEVYAIYVQPEFTRIGIGEKLMNSVFEIARKEKYQEIMIWVLDGNKKGSNFYKKIGFFEDGKKKIIEKWNREENRMIRLLTIASSL
jgi:ribosomal protein S18 acetylase RimI-like enzyme